MKYIYWTNERSKRGEGNDKGERKRRKSMIKKKGKCNDETKNSIYMVLMIPLLCSCVGVCVEQARQQNLCAPMNSILTQIFLTLYFW